MGNVSGHQGKKKGGSEKKRTGTHVSRKFLEVLNCSLAKTAAKKCTKKCAAGAKLFFLLIRLITFCFRRCLALHNFIFCLSKLSVC